MGDSMAVYVGDTRAVYRGFFHKLDSEDYTKAAKKNGKNVLIPSAFAKQYFGEDVSVDTDGYFDLTAYCDANDQYHYYFDGYRLCIVSPKDVIPFNDFDSVNHGYTDKKHIERLA